MKLLSYLLIGFGVKRIHIFFILQVWKYVKWSIGIDSGSKVDVQKWGQRYEGHKNFLKSPYPEYLISNPFQQVLLKNETPFV